MESPVAILKRHNLRPKKSWGQCFIDDPNVVARIADHAELLSTDTVVEIGAGLGTLTMALASRASQVVAIERDRDLVCILRVELSTAANIEIVEGNALTYDFSRGVDQNGVKVVGNLPYNISSQLLFRILDQRQWIRDATLMFQKEVAERIVAQPGTRTYGVPSILCQQYAKVHRCFSVPSGAFRPRPRVDSAVIKLAMRQQPRMPCDETQFRLVVRTAFGARRKTLRNSLLPRFGVEAVEFALKSADIDSRRRPETLSIEDFGRIALALETALSSS
jgi:16S rRNA (adenine1518-N6/adenine1519-N6)-dimethyltransferase